MMLIAKRYFTIGFGKYLPFFYHFSFNRRFFWDEAQIIRGNEGIVGLSAPSLKGAAVRGAVQMSVIAALGAVAVDELEQLRTPVALVERRIVQEAEDGPLPAALNEASSRSASRASILPVCVPAASSS